MLVLQGFNIAKKSTKRFEVEFSEQSLDNLYFTFDSIYLVNYCSTNNPQPLIFDSHCFRVLYETNSESFRFLSFCSNTNYFCCLALDSSDQNTNMFGNFLLLQYSNKNLIKKINLSISVHSALEDLLILSTDVNLYLLENAKDGLKCLYQLRKKADLDEIKLNKEIQLSESSTSCLPLNQVLIDEKVSQFSCGKEHILFLTETTKRLYSFGIGTKGQLGLGKIENRYEPTLVKTPSNIKIQSIYAGGWHSAYLDEKFNCYLWGWNLNGQVSVANEQNNSVFVIKPTKLAIFDNGEEVKFTSVSLGSRHSALIDTKGNLFMFGWNKYGQLFLEVFEGEDGDHNIEKPVKIDFEKIVKKVKCSCWLTSLLI